jgi:hypothetical protein
LGGFIGDGLRWGGGFRGGKACFDHAVAEIEEGVELGVGLGVLLEDFGDDEDGVCVDTEDDGGEGLALLEDETVVT